MGSGNLGSGRKSKILMVLSIGPMELKGSRIEGVCP